MPVFTYEAKNIEGQLIKNKMEAHSREEIVKSLRTRGYYPIVIQEEGTGLNKEVELFEKINLKDIALFCRQFSFVLQSGMPMMKAIEISLEQCEKKKLKDILKRTKAQVSKGRPLSDALRHEEDIPELMTNMIAAGESSGNLDYIMMELSEYYSKQYKQKQKISGAMMYPKIVMSFSVVVVLGMMTFIVPSFVENLGLDQSQLPVPTAILLSISNFLKNYWFIWASILVIIVATKKLVLDKDPVYQEGKDKRALSGKIMGKVNQQLLAARFASTFSVLLASGLGIIQTLEIVSKVLENKYAEKKVEQAKEDIKKGNPIGKTIEDLNVFPRMLTQMISIGEETGKMEEITKKTADFYDGEAQAAVEKMITSIEPIMIIGLAIIVFFIVLSLLLPMYETVGKMA